jgi:hypothetical protein
MTSFLFVPRDVRSSRGVSPSPISGRESREASLLPKRWSHVGRPRHVTDAVIAEILDWHRNHETCVQLARRLGVSTSTVRNVIRSGGQHYKTPSPERRAEALRALREHADRAVRR